jgi:Domain of Unknown Function (DUF1080)
MGWTRRHPFRPVAGRASGAAGSDRCGQGGLTGQVRLHVGQITPVGVAQIELGGCCRTFRYFGPPEHLARFEKEVQRAVEASFTWRTTRSYGQLAVGRGYEIQIDDSGFNPDTTNTGDPAHETGAIYAIQAPSKLASNPTDQWNTYRIRAQADKINVWLNGTQVITNFVVDKVRPRKGHIGLQNHSGVTGPSLAEFRNLQIVDL